MPRDTVSPIDQRLVDYEAGWRFLGVKRSTFYRLIADGKLKPVRLGGRVCRVDIVDLEKLIETSKAA